MSAVVTAVIPARLNSARLPGKVLADIDGHPLIWHTWNRAKQARCIGDVCIATDSDEIGAIAESWDGNPRVLKTSESPRCGTERIAEIIGELVGDLIVNIPADEPLIDPALLDRLVSDWILSPCDLITPVFHLEDAASLTDPSVVKVVRAQNGDALYFSRSPIPAVRDSPPEEWLHQHAYWGHIGVYGYSRAILERYGELPPSSLEQVESLEQLRFMDAGYRIRTIETKHAGTAVNTPGDLERVRSLMVGSEAGST